MNNWPYKIVSLTRQEIDDAIQDDHWQQVRLSMKGVATPEKLRILKDYRTQCINSGKGTLSRKHQVQIDNYINALLRGGQLKREAGDRIVVQR